MKKILLFLLILSVAATIVLRVRYGGGVTYPDLSTAPRLAEDSLETVLTYPEPIGNLAVSNQGRLFFTVHPEARPQGNRLLEFVNGASVPFPNAQSQLQLFDTVLGIVVDEQDRLWTIDHGYHGLRDARLLAFDLETGDVVHDHRFAAEIAPVGSFLQDLQLSEDGRTIVIADASILGKRPALIVYDIGTATARRVLEGHPSVATEDFVIRTPARTMTFLGNLLALRGGVDGIALGRDWLYYGALTGSGLYRVAVRDLFNAETPNDQLADRVERVADKPLSDGLSIDLEGNVYGTDVEHGAVFVIDRNGRLSTVVRSAQIRWPDALSFGPDGWLYIADSALADVVLRSRADIAQNAPYRIFRAQPGTSGRPGH